MCPPVLHIFRLSKIAQHSFSTVGTDSQLDWVLGVDWANIAVHKSFLCKLFYYKSNFMFWVFVMLEGEPLPQNEIFWRIYLVFQSCLVFNSSCLVLLSLNHKILEAVIIVHFLADIFLPLSFLWIFLNREQLDSLAMIIFRLILLVCLVSKTICWAKIKSTFFFYVCIGCKTVTFCWL